MAECWAIVVGIEKFLHPELGSVPFAEADAAALAAALEGAGYPATRQIVLPGPHATKAAIEARLRRLKKSVKRGDTVLAAWLGRGCLAGGRSLLPAWDALPDDLAETSIPLADWVNGLTGTKAGQVVFLFAAGVGPAIAGSDATPHLALDKFGRLFDDSAKAVALAASAEDEPAHAAPAARHGLWTQLVAEALAGQARSAADPDGRVTALSLQRFVEEELPRRLRRHYEAGVRQTPQLYGAQNAAAVIADLSAVLTDREGGAVLDPARLRRVVFRSESTTRVRDLSQYRKTYQIPDAAGPSARKFFARVAAPDLRADLDRVYEAAREHLGYKRKDLDLHAGQDGYGTIRTPDFEYSVFVDLDVDDPSRLAWRREAGQFADPGFVRGPQFEAVFGPAFDQLVFEFAKPVYVAEFIDRIEDDPPPGVKVAVSSDGSACDLTLAGFAGMVTLRRHAVTVRGRSTTSAGLLDLFLHFLRTFGPVGEPPALPPKPGD